MFGSGKIRRQIFCRRRTQNGDFSAVVLDDAKRYGKAQARAFADFLGSKKRIKYLGKIAVGHAFSSVGYTDHNPPPTRTDFRLHRYDTVLANGIGGVIHEIQPNLFQPLFITDHLRNCLFKRK